MSDKNIAIGMVALVILILGIYQIVSVVDLYSTLEGKAERMCRDEGYGSWVKVDYHWKRVECYNEIWQSVILDIDDNNNLLLHRVRTPREVLPR